MLQPLLPDQAPRRKRQGERTGGSSGAFLALSVLTSQDSLVSVDGFHQNAPFPP